jgi:hypothetical protein
MSEMDEKLPPWASVTADIEQPTIARIYDYLLGGYHNFESDREVAKASLQIYPDLALASQVSRAFLRRVTNYLLDHGITQFIDIGSGIPTLGHVHEIAQARDPQNRVVYVDIDQVAIAHSKVILQGNTSTLILEADAREPATIFNAIEAEGFLDLDKPTAVLFIALLHFIVDDDQMQQLFNTYRRRLAPGSYIAITHGTYENAPPGVAEGIMQLSSQTRHTAKYRKHEELVDLFREMELIDPGLVPTPSWRPENSEDLFYEEPERSLAYAGIGRVP